MEDTEARQRGRGMVVTGEGGLVYVVDINGRRGETKAFSALGQSLNPPHLYYTTNRGIFPRMTAATTTLLTGVCSPAWQQQATIACRSGKVISVRFLTRLSIPWYQSDQWECNANMGGSSISTPYNKWSFWPMNSRCLYSAQPPFCQAASHKPRQGRTDLPRVCISVTRQTDH